jgi:plastocyanin
MRRRLTSIALAMGLFGTISAQPAQAAVVIKGVEMSGQYASGFEWSPRVERVAPGTKVVWKAVSGTHTVTAYKGPWDTSTTITEGAKTSFTFEKERRYRFRCELHSELEDGVCTGMCGKVVVR